MPKSRPPCPREFRQRIIELVRKGPSPESLAEQLARIRPDVGRPGGRTSRFVKEGPEIGGQASGILLAYDAEP
jgi:hypothetical protein